MTPRLLLGAASALALLFTVSCNTDTPLAAEVENHTVSPGGKVTGKVVFPEGKIRVTLVPIDSPVVKDAKFSGHRDKGKQSCSYSEKKFTCSTDGLPEGLYVVQVTDDGMPGEGTATDLVTVTDIDGYDPKWKVDGDVVRLTGWKPDSTVKAQILDGDEKPIITRKLSTDGSGAAELPIGALTTSIYEISLTDGLWRLGNATWGYSVLDLT